MTDEQIHDPLITVTLNDLMSGMISVNENVVGMTNLTETMKQDLISGVSRVKSYVANAAYNYYSMNDFEPTPEVIPLMRDIVECYAEDGGRL